jgi:hypothetical protein
MMYEEISIIRDVCWMIGGGLVTFAVCATALRLASRLLGMIEDPVDDHDYCSRCGSDFDESLVPYAEERTEQGTTRIYVCKCDPCLQERSSHDER